MRFRIGFVVGLGAGYVLGTKAGRERYEQIRRWWRSFSGSPQVQHLAERGKEVAGEATHKGLDVAQRGVSKVGTSVKERLSKNGDDVDVQQVGL